MKGAISAVAVVSMVVASLCAAQTGTPPTPNSLQWQTISTRFPAEALMKLDLCFYLVENSWWEGEAAPAVPAGYKILAGDSERHLVKVEPTFSAVDVSSLDWQPGPQRTRGDGTFQHLPYVMFTMRDRQKFGDLCAANVGKQMLLASGDTPICAHRIESRVPGRGIIELRYLQKGGKVLLPYLKGMPCSEGLTVSGIPEQVPGTARLRITTWFADGTKAGGSCELTPPPGPLSNPAWPVLAPTIVKEDAGWTIFNLVPGKWHYEMNGHFLPVHSEIQVGAGDDRRLDPEVKHGATVMGRVVRDEDGSPVAGAAVQASSQREFNTDETGRFTLSEVAPDAQFVVRAEGLAATITKLGALAEGEEVTVPEIRLTRGGSILGRVEVAGGLPAGFNWCGCVFPELSAVGIFLADEIRPDLAFRLGPIAPGTYSLKALLGNDDIGPAEDQRRWWGTVGNVEVREGRDTTGVVITVSEAKQPWPDELWQF